MYNVDLVGLGVIDGVLVTVGVIDGVGAAGVTEGDGVLVGVIVGVGVIEGHIVLEITIV